MPGADGTHFPRRDFFRNALRRAIAPLVESFWEKTEADQPSSPGGPHVPLRPPGAISEDRFNEVCHRCGACVDVCPARAIVPWREGGRGDGTPIIEADVAACVVCDGLQCTHVCPSGALLPLTTARNIRMGVAEVYAGLCVRSNGEPCLLCVERCPIGPSAIRFEDHGPPVVSVDGCVGCGICQLYCPTTPKAIVVVPAAGGRTADEATDQKLSQTVAAQGCARSSQLNVPGFQASARTEVRGSQDCEIDSKGPLLTLPQGS